MTLRLFPIPLYGLDAADVESLPSYLHRISYAHGIYVGELIRFVYRYGINELEKSEDLPQMPKYLAVEEIVLPNKTTNMLIDFLEAMSRQNIRSSVLWFLDGAIGRCSGEITPGFRWCPECFEDMLNINQEPYFKLIWHLKDIKYCHEHRSPLLDRCPFCGCDQTGYKKTRSIGYCQDCGESLSKRNNYLFSYDLCHSWEAIGSDILQLFNDLSDYEASSINLHGLRKSLSHLYDYYWSQERESELYELMPKCKLLAFIEGRQNISLKIVRRFAYKLGITLFDLLSRNAHQTSAFLNSDWLCEIPPSFMVIQKRTERDHDYIHSSILRTIHDSESPMSLKEIAKLKSVSEGYIQHRYPLLAKSIVKTYQHHLDEEMRKKISNAQAAAMKFFNDEKYSGYYKSRKEAYKILRKETGLPKFILKKAIQEAYTLLNF